MIRIVLALVLLLVPTADAGIVLELRGNIQGPIDGDVTDPQLENLIDVASLSWGADKVLDGAPGSSDPPLVLRELTFAKQWDSASVRMLRAQGDSERLEATFFVGVGSFIQQTADTELARRMPRSGEYLQIRLSDAYITSMSTAGATNEASFETVTMFYGSIEFLDPRTGERVELAQPRLRQALPLDGPRRTVKPVPGVFDFVLPDAGGVDVEIVDADGNLVMRLSDDAEARENGLLRWDATDLDGQRVPAGEYTATVRTAGQEITRRMVVGG